MTPEQRYRWTVALELKLRQCSGEQFQDFFSRVMAKKHPSDFVQIRPFGQKGDKGCDGYLASDGTVFQCYGALNGSAKVKTLTSKMELDYGKAASKLPEIMKRWTMTHNIIGLPADAVLELDKLKKTYTDIGFSFLGPEKIKEIVLSLPVADIEELLGPAATAKDAEELQWGALKELVDDFVTATASILPSADLKPVPVNKLSLNKLSGHWKMFIAGGWMNAPAIAAYFDQHPDPSRGQAIANRFSDRYQSLKAQELAPDTIMAELYASIVGEVVVSPQKQVVAQALLSFLFEQCDIFERESAVVPA